MHVITPYMVFVLQMINWERSAKFFFGQSQKASKQAWWDRWIDVLLTSLPRKQWKLSKWRNDDCCSTYNQNWDFPKEEKSDKFQYLASLRSRLEWQFIPSGKKLSSRSTTVIAFQNDTYTVRSLKLIQNNRIIRIQYQTNDQKRCGMGITTATDNYNHLKCYIIDFLRKGECANSYHFLIWTMKVYHKHEPITCRHLKRKNGVYKVNDSYEFSKVKENTLSEETIRFCSDLRISCQ